MKHATIFSVAIAMGIAVLATSSVGYGEATLEGATLGTHAAGPAVTMNDLKGRVVLFEYWGVNCGPCKAQIPHIVKLQEEYDRSRFVVVANHCQGGGAANAGNVWKGLAGGSDAVSVVDRGNLPGSNVTGIPRCFLFDHEGKLVYEGHPANVDSALKEAIAKSPGFLVAGLELNTLKREGALLAAMRSNMSRTLNRLRTLAGDPAQRGHDEAVALLERVETWAKSELERVSKDPAADALNTDATIDKMSKLLRGDALGEGFVELDKKLRADAAFQDEMRAARMLLQIKHSASPLSSGASMSSSRENATRNTVRNGILVLKKKYPDTRAAAQADELAKQLSL